MNTSESTGRLKVSLESPEPNYVEQPISVIDGTTFELVTSSTCEAEISLPAGTYLVSATLPTGERSVGVAEIVSDELSELALGVVEQPTSAAPAPPAAGTLESLGPAHGEDAAAPSVWFVRFHVRLPDGSFEPAVPQVSVQETVDRAELLVRASGDGILFAQVARSGEIPLNVVLPIYGPTSSQSCRLTLEGGAQASTAAVSLPDNPTVDAVARYLNSGHLQEAANVTGDAEALLQQKLADPFGAALGAYVLLRLGRLDRLHHWPRNLSEWFPWLPDGAVIAGEEAALEGDHTTAIALVCEGGRRGLPVFSAGLSLLGSRLREYAGAPKETFGDNGELVVEAEKLLQGVLRVMPFVDFDRVSLAYRGARVDDPAGSQTPLTVPARDGWRNVTDL